MLCIKITVDKLPQKFYVIYIDIRILMVLEFWIFINRILMNYKYLYNIIVCYKIKSTLIGTVNDIIIIYQYTYQSNSIEPNIILINTILLY